MKKYYKISTEMKSTRSVLAKIAVSFLTFTGIQSVNAQSNTLPPSGNVGIGTTMPTSRLQVNGTAQIDSSLYVKDSIIIQKSAVVKDVLRVESDVIVKGDINVKNDLKVKGKAVFKGDVVIKEGDLKLKNIADSLQDGYSVLLINKNGKVVNGGSPMGLFYGVPPIFSEIHCELILDADLPQWERASQQMYLLPNRCLPDPKLGIGVKPTAKLHVLNTEEETKPLLIERKIGNYPKYKLLQLDNNGVLSAREVKVDLNAWPDYVFKKDYELKPIYEVKSFINQHGHLPNVPTAQEIETNGVNLGDMTKITMEKVEELTLYLIQLQELVDKQQQQLAEQQKLIEKQQQQINALLK